MGCLSEVVHYNNLGRENQIWKIKRAWNANCVQTQSGGAGDGNRTRNLSLGS